MAVAGSTGSNQQDGVAAQASVSAADVSYVYPDATVGVVQDLADATKGVSLVGYKAAGASAVSRSLAKRAEYEGKSRVNVIDYMTEAMIADVYAGTRAVDTYPAYVAAQNALPLDGGLLIAPAGTSRLDSEFTLRHGVSLHGTGSMYSTNGVAPGNTVFVPNHSGRSAISLVGANGCHLNNFTIKAYPEAYPKAGLVLGRSSPASAGQHHIDGVSVLGHYSQAAVYSIASEDILLTQLYVWIFGGGARHGFHTGISDTLGLGGLVASSNLHIDLIHPFIINSSADPDAACIYIEGAQAVGNLKVVGGYCIAFSGSYIQLNLGAIDALSPIGTFGFDVNGERLSGGDPLYGIRITAVGTQTLKGFSVSGGRFDLLSSGSTTHYDILVPGNVVLDAPNIVMPPPEAFPYATSRVNRPNIHGGVVSVGRTTRWTALAFAGGWADSFGPPVAAAGWRIDSDNKVVLRGTVSGGAVGVLATLPLEARPQSDLFFPVSTGASPVIGRVRITAATGAITLSGTQFVQVDLSGISFNLMA
ncbi:hypothetical protein AAIM60_23515 [Pseudomonas lijiangensis]|uniref:hypothetical protein n=1 Tax=Pseudomonas lijiangensis TaxID=2995658 RepID=UPI0031BB111B